MIKAVTCLSNHSRDKGTFSLPFYGIGLRGCRALTPTLTCTGVTLHHLTLHVFWFFSKPKQWAPNRCSSELKSEKTNLKLRCMKSLEADGDDDENDDFFPL